MSKHMAKADVVFSKLIRDRGGHCLSCFSTDRLQCAHIIPRSYKAIRTDFDNAVTLCRRCHMRFTYNPLEWREWVEEKFPGRWDTLRVAALSYERVDWKYRLSALREIARTLEVS